MSQSTKLVKTQTKGMVTIPKEFRVQLGIESNSVLEAKLVDDGVLFTKPQSAEIYTDKQISEWMKTDALDAKTAKKLKKLLTA